MAIKSYARSAPCNGKMDMTLEEFKKWVKSFDEDEDGRIDRSELQEAIQAAGVRFSWLRGRQGMKAADQNGDGFIDADELAKLADFAQNHLNVRIVTY
ncbi:unnamed protein product [Cuscuta campestris]|uniref:EF-hand domain-containing protein n=1 Tax=Cuscuta campestris TaxID=132261 RepID=A0A484MFJ8_9ASTE|nr:unnamed protein product [Cuscuta campestris]